MAIKNIDELRGMLNVAVAFQNSADLIEQHIASVGFHYDDGTRISTPNSRTKREIWMALKATSHFNLHQSFEVFLKFILRLEATNHGRGHPLGKLYDMLSAASQKQMDRAYEHAIATIEKEQRSWVGFYYGKEAPSRPPDHDMTTAKQGLEHFDEFLRLHQRRYEYENIGRGEWRVYIINMSLWFNMLSEISRYAHELFWESVQSQDSGGLV